MFNVRMPMATELPGLCSIKFPALVIRRLGGLSSCVLPIVWALRLPLGKFLLLTRSQKQIMEKDFICGTSR